jgi:hypothetical protein
MMRDRNGRSPRMVRWRRVSAAVVLGLLAAGLSGGSTWASVGVYGRLAFSPASAEAAVPVSSGAWSLPSVGQPSEPIVALILGAGLIGLGVLVRRRGR